MLRKKVYLNLVILSILAATAPAVFAVGDNVITYDLNTNHVFCFAPDGSQVWVSQPIPIGLDHSGGKMEMGYDGYVYLAKEGGNGGLTKIDPATGAVTVVQANPTPHNWYDITFGPDIDGDRMPDLYVGTASTTIRSYTSSSGYANSSGAIFVASGLGLTKATWLCFGSDLTSDNTPELFVYDANQAKVYVFDGKTGALVTSWPCIGAADISYNELDGRIYLINRSAPQGPHSYLPDGTGYKTPGIDYNNVWAASPTIVVRAPYPDYSWYVVNEGANPFTTYPSIWKCDPDFSTDGVLFKQQYNWRLFGICIPYERAPYDPSPTSGDLSVQAHNATTLSWSNLEDVVKCDLYFGTEPNLLSMTKVTITNPAERETVGIPAAYLPLADLTHYYWLVDNYRGIPDPNDPNTLTTPATPNLPGYFWKFRTSYNIAPVVDVPNQYLWQDNDGDPNTTLAFTPVVTDDGLPLGNSLTYQWTQLAGPAVAIDPNDAVLKDLTLVLTQLSNDYQFQLTVSDGDLTTTVKPRVVLAADSCAASSQDPDFSYALGDITKDCFVDMADFREMAVNWLECNNLGGCN